MKDVLSTPPVLNCGFGFCGPMQGTLISADAARSAHIAAFQGWLRTARPTPEAALAEVEGTASALRQLVILMLASGLSHPERGA